MAVCETRRFSITADRRSSSLAVQSLRRSSSSLFFVFFLILLFDSFAGVESFTQS